MNLAGTNSIETDRLILRRFTTDDAEDMYMNWASDPQVTKYLTWPTHGSVEVTRQVLGDWIPRYEDGGYFNWALVLKETGAVIGNIAVVRLDEAVEAAEVGYCLSRAYWGQGIMTEALTAVIHDLFERVRVHRVAAYHDANNPASGRVMEKAGMKPEGVMRQAKANNTGVCDVVWHAILRSDLECSGRPQPDKPVKDTCREDLI